MDTVVNRTWRTPWAVLICGSFVVLFTIGLRTSFGLFLKPMSFNLGWGRETFAFAMALQNLLWGVFQPFAGAVADKWGTGRVVASGGLLYGLGLYLMSQTASPLELYMSGGVLIAMGASGAGLAVVLGAVGRTVPSAQRSLALGIVTAAGSVGQFMVVPIGHTFLSHFGWSRALQLMGLFGLMMLPLAASLAGRNEPAAGPGEQSLGQALDEARQHSGFRYLTAGFFVCGFHVAFIAVHLPAYLNDKGLSAGAGALALSLIGLFNIVGTTISGLLGGKRSKKNLLSGLYLARAAAFLAFILVPLNMWSAMGFAAIIGFLWLGTVPLTSGLVAQIFGPRYMSMLFGVVFLSHQVGSFIGVWLGGYLFDLTGSYVIVWWLSVALGILAALLHLPINEQPVARLILEPIQRAHSP